MSKRKFAYIPLALFIIGIALSLLGMILDEMSLVYVSLVFNGVGWLLLVFLCFFLIPGGHINEQLPG